LNREGAGVFVTVNETDLKGRTAKNITSVRAVFVDLDGAPLEPVRIPMKTATCSDGKRPPVPIQIGHFCRCSIWAA
jgi:hypothetical protein